MSIEIKRITAGPKHHLFGFHDLVQTNAKGDLALSLEVDNISHPPLPGETCLSGVVSSCGGEFMPVHKTHTWNYPQGARQQWIGESDLFTCNDRDDKGSLISHICDGRHREVKETLPFPVHCLAGNQAFFFNYDRIHSVGGYGYKPMQKCPTKKLKEDLPNDDGLFVGDIYSKKHHLLVSISDIASCGEKGPVKTGYPHYVTHALLNPAGTRIAFLHRYRVVDGGETTRLMTIGVDGHGLRCLGKGFLSHFTWISNDELLIWGENQYALCAFRELPYLRIPGVLQGMLLAKKLMRGMRGLRKSSIANSNIIQRKAFLKIKDDDSGVVDKIALGVLKEDGHPMSRPGELTFLINDTYPDSNGDRTLMFYDVVNNKRTDIGKYRMIFESPNCENFDLDAAKSSMDRRVLKKSNLKDFLFYRSGYHCDLHPRWSANGKIAFFDSIHEGSRQIYSVTGLL